MMSNAEKFATSLVSLAVARNGYETIRDFTGSGEQPPIILVAGNARGKKNFNETFAVEIKVIRDPKNISRQLKDLKAQHLPSFADAVYFAFFIDNQKLLLVEEALRQRMRFRDDEIRLETLDALTP